MKLAPGLVTLAQVLGFIDGPYQPPKLNDNEIELIEMEVTRDGKPVRVTVQLQDPEEECPHCELGYVDDDSTDEEYDCPHCDGTNWTPVRILKSFTADAQMNEVALKPFEKEQARKVYQEFREKEYK